MQPEAILLIGLPKCGKSTFVKFFFSNYTIIQSDNFPSTSKPHGFYQKCDTAKREKQNVIIDGCNHTVAARKEILHTFRETHKISYIHFNLKFRHSLSLYQFKNDAEARKLFMSIKKCIEFPQLTEKVKVYTVHEVFPKATQNKALFIPLDYCDKNLRNLRTYQEMGYKIIGISNSNDEDFNSFQDKIIKKISNIPIHLNDFLCCWHKFVPCNCKMPKTGLIYEAIQKHNLDLYDCVIVGKGQEEHLSKLIKMRFMHIDEFTF